MTKTLFAFFTSLFLALSLIGCTDDRRVQPTDDSGPPTGDGGIVDDAEPDVPIGDSASGDAGDVDAGIPDAGPALPTRGQPCGGESGTDCAADLECVTEGALSMCVGLCDADDYSGCERNETCNLPIDASRVGCFPTCDLLTNEGCPAGSTCGVFGDETGAVYKGCDTAGPRTQGEDCGASNKCAVGHICSYWSSRGLASGFECLQFCDPTGAEGPSCPEGTTCSSAPRESDPFAAIDGLGACR